MKESVNKVKNLNKFDISLEGNIEEILADPRAWAEELVENIALLEVNRFREARKLGKEFADALVN